MVSVLRRHPLGIAGECCGLRTPWSMERTTAHTVGQWEYNSNDVPQMCCRGRPIKHSKWCTERWQQGGGRRTRYRISGGQLHHGVHHRSRHQGVLVGGLPDVVTHRQPLRHALVSQTHRQHTCDTPTIKGGYRVLVKGLSNVVRDSQALHHSSF